MSQCPTRGHRAATAGVMTRWRNDHATTRRRGGTGTMAQAPATSGGPTGLHHVAGNPTQGHNDDEGVSAH
jgi:hypothetical protein